MRALARIIPVLALVAPIVSLRPIAAAQQQATPDLAAIDRYVDDQRQVAHVPGIAVAIVQDGQTVHLKGFGTADATGRAVTPQTPFLIGSLSKSITGLAIMQLVEAGQIELDAPVQRYIPWFRVSDAEASSSITVRHLLYQTSGFPGTAGNNAIAGGDTSPGATEREVRALSSIELSGPVGAGYQYSNANYIVLGLVVETVAGRSYASYVQEHILRPIGMTRSFTSKEDARDNGLASGHRYWFGVPVPADLPYGQAILPAGYVISTAEDMGRYLAMYQNGGRAGGKTILSPSGMAELLRPGAEAGGPDVFYAMGWTVAQDGDVTVLGHAGGTFDFRAAMGLLPEQRLGYVVLMNADTALGRGRLTGISEGVYGLLLGREPAPSESNVRTLLVYAVLVGVVLVQLIGMLRTLLMLRRWSAQPERRPRGSFKLAWHLGQPLITNLAWAAVALLVLPNLFGGSMVRLQIPDLAYLLTVSGGIAVAWAACRTVLVLRAVRAPRPSARLAVVLSRA
jgi:CubicO group peptidase (beta-lactamase class C family)